MAGERIHYGSLESMAEKARGGGSNLAVSFTQGTAQPETLAFSNASLQSSRYDEQMAEFDARKKAKNLVLPTDDRLVQARLRELGEPIILFGEQPPERRDRLRDFMVRKGIENGMPASSIPGYEPTATAKPIQEQEPDELFYTEGTPFLKFVRVAIAKYSIPRAQERISRAKLLRKRDEADGGAGIEREASELKKLCSTFDKFTNVASQVGDDRPLSNVQFSHDSEHIVTSSWSGLAKLWKISDCSLVQTFSGHTDRCTNIIFHPFAATQSPSSCNLASSGADGRVMLWSLENSKPISTFEGHEHRVNKVAFHPSGKYLGSASHDLTWRLWDIESGKDILEQEGHSRPILAIGFQTDGSLICSAGMDHIGRVWDLRSGKSVYVMRGHSKQIVDLDWAPNGYQIATCSEDNTVRIWDLRKKRPIYIVPAHENLVSHVKYHAEGRLIITSSFDNTCKLWNGNDWTPIKTVQANEGKVMGCDLSPNFKYIVTANYDRTWKLFTHDETAMMI